MTTALRSRPSAHARELILEEVAKHPYIQQRELAARLHKLTGLAEPTLITLFQQLARAGELEPGLDGRRRTYCLPLMKTPMSSGAWECRGVVQAEHPRDGAGGQ